MLCLIVLYSMWIIHKIMTATWYFSLCFFLKREGGEHIPGGLHGWGRNNSETSWHETCLQFRLWCFVLVVWWVSSPPRQPEPGLRDPGGTAPGTSLRWLQYLSVCLRPDRLWKIIHVSLIADTALQKDLHLLWAAAWFDRKHIVFENTQLWAQTSPVLFTSWFRKLGQVA